MPGVFGAIRQVGQGEREAALAAVEGLVSLLRAELAAESSVTPGAVWHDPMGSVPDMLSVEAAQHAQSKRRGD